MLFNKIKPIYFFVSLFVGFLLTYIFTPLPDIIYQYPTPENKEQVYVDSAKICFKYKPKKIECPKDQNKISKYPIQSTKKILKN